MKNLILAITGLISICFAAIVIGILFLANLELNNYKDWISEQFNEQTGLELTIAGNIDSSIYPWLGLEVEGLSISNPDGFTAENLVLAEHAAFRVKLIPLLNQAYEIDTIELAGATINLERNAAGESNWTSISASDEEEANDEAAADSGFNLNSLIIGGVSIDAVLINYNDQLNAQTISASNLAINIPELVYGEPLDIAMSFQLSATNPELESDVSLASTINYDLDNNMYALEDLNLTFLDGLLEADLRSMDGLINGSINFSTERSQELFALLGQSELAANLDDSNSAINLSSNVSYDLDENNYAVNDFNLEFLGTTLEMNLRNTDGDLNGSVNFTAERTREILSLAGQDDLAERVSDVQLFVFLEGDTENIQLLPIDLNLGLFGEPLNAPANVHFYTNAEVDIEDENIMFNDVSLTVLDMMLTGKFNISDYQDDAEISGEFDLESFNPREVLSALTIDLPATRDPQVLQQLAFSTSLDATTNSLELNRFIVELDNTLITGSLSAANFDQPDIEFDVDINTIDVDRYLSPEQGDTAAVTEADNEPSFSTLQTLDLDGQLAIDTLRISGLQMSEVLLGINANQGLISMDPIRADIYQGSFTGAADININTAQPQFSLQSTLQDIDIEPLSNDLIGASYAGGNGSINLALVGSGSSAETILPGLNGNAELSLDNGILQGVDVGAVLAQLETMLQSRQLLAMNRGEQTAFDNLSASIKIANGVASSNDLLIEAPGFNVSGSGTLANLQNQRIDFDLLATVNQASATVADEQYDIGGYSLPINCSGVMNAPSCLPDFESIVSAAISNVIQEGIGNVLEEGVGGLLDQALGTGNRETEAEPGTEGEVSETTEEEGSTEQSDPASEIFNSVLDRLLN